MTEKEFNLTYFQIGNLKIGDDFKPLIIADIGINHGGNLKVAISIVDKAIDAGATVIKHQTHIPNDEMSIEAKNVIPGNSDRSIYEIISSCALNENDELYLKEYIEARGSLFLSTPFSRAAVERLARFGVVGFKVGSGECNNYPLLRCIAKHRKPVILSTGMNNIPSIKKAVRILSETCPVAILHCTNLYPTPPHLTRLGGIYDLKTAFPNHVIGYSDHSKSIYPSVGAVALGANIIERHFTDSYNRIGEDICCSMDPKQLSELIVATEEAWLSRGGNRDICEEEKVTSAFAFVSVVSISDIEPGESLNENNIWVKRPSGGDFTAEDYENLFGKVAKKFITANKQLKNTDIE
jgi:N-acetylneuraminate synthase